MSPTTSTILLWLFVINLGIAFGAGLYEHRIVVSRWISSSPETGAHWNAEAVRQDDTGLRFWAFVTFPVSHRQSAGARDRVSESVSGCVDTRSC